MKTMKKIAVYSLLCMLLAINMMCTACGKQDGDIGITRGQWIAALGDAFGMSEYQNADSYFSDIQSGDEIFAYLQSMKEWGIVGLEDTFEKDDVATREFIAQTAVLASEAVETTDDIKSDYEKAKTYAVENALLLSDKKSYLKEGVSKEESETIIEWALNQYDYSDVEPKAEVEYAEHVYQMSGDEAMNTVMNADASVLVPDSFADKVSPGDVIITPPTKENPGGQAKKVVKKEKSGDKTKIDTEDPDDIADVAKKIDIQNVTVVPKAEDFVLEDGFTMVQSQTSGVYENITYVGGKKDNVSLKNMKTYSGGASEKNFFHMDVTLPKGKVNVKISDEWEKSFELLKKDLKDQGVSSEEEKETISLFEQMNKAYVHGASGPKISDCMKYESGYRIEGTFDISDVTANVTCKTKEKFSFKNLLNPIEELDVKISYKASTKLSYYGHIDANIDVGEVPLPIGNTGIIVKLKFYLALDANGNLKLYSNFDNNINYRYKDGHVKKTKEGNKAEKGVTANIRMDFGPGMAVNIEAWQLNVIDMDALVQMSFVVDGKLVETKENGKKSTDWQYSITGKAPLLTLSVGEKTGWMKALKFNNTFKIITYETAPTILSIKNKKAVLSKEQEEEEGGKENIDAINSERLALDTYSLNLDIGEVVLAEIQELPASYKKEDVVFSSADSGIATVTKDGAITGVKGGSTIITAKTSDGKYSCDCAVTVLDNQTIDFTPLED